MAMRMGWLLLPVSFDEAVIGGDGVGDLPVRVDESGDESCRPNSKIWAMPVCDSRACA
jgi:hypothetical protein